MVKNAETIVSIELKKSSEYQLIIKVGLETKVESRPFKPCDLQNMVNYSRNMLSKIRKIYEKNPTKTELEQIENLHRSIEIIRLFNTYFRVIVGDEFYQKMQAQLGKLLKKHPATMPIHEKPVGRIIFEASLEDFIPLDFLFVENEEDDYREETPESAIRYISHLLGYSFLINRHPSTLKEKVYLDNKQVIVKLYTDDHVSKDKELIKSIREFFVDHNNNCSLALSKTPDKVIEDLVVDDHNNTNCHHFFCHSNTTSNQDWEHHLIFGSPTLGAKTNLLDLLHQLNKQQNKLLNGHIIFLNACGSAVINSHHTITFPKFFIDLMKCRAFIGVESDIFTSFACEFTKKFYHYLWESGQLDMALYQTRWYFAKTEFNLLGLFYTLYAAPYTIGE